MAHHNVDSADDVIVMRGSPDWLRLDLSETRPFLRAHNLPEDLLEQFVALWDGAIIPDYRTFRAQLKHISLATVDQVSGALAIHLRDIDHRDVPQRTRIAFTDDDDWFSPALFADLPRAAVNGYRWGSCRIGFDFDPTAPNPAIISLRPLSEVVYTNNYAVQALDGIDELRKLSDHRQANKRFREKAFECLSSPEYLSCAVKHPCSTVAALHLLRDAAFVNDPYAVLVRFVTELNDAVIPAGAEWIGSPLRELRSAVSAMKPRFRKIRSAALFRN
ncbi:MAG TPA: hypothetical protein VIL42_04055 [Sphingomicrobium sp.]|jgi:hypothetical protein